MHPDFTDEEINHVRLHTAETVNVPGCRRLMKAGFAFVGSWRVSRDPLSLLSASRRLALLACRGFDTSEGVPEHE